MSDIQTTGNPRNPEKPEKAEETTGPKVCLDIPGDGHFEPDAEEILDLGLENFSSWQSVPASSLTPALALVAIRERMPRQYRGNDRCEDPIYFKGLERYLEKISEPASTTPLAPSILISAVNHALDYGGNHELLASLIRAIEEAEPEVKGAILSALVQKCEESKNAVSNELAITLAKCLTVAPESVQAGMISILSNSSSETAIELAKKAVKEFAVNSSSGPTLEQAVLLLRRDQSEETQKIMEKCLSIAGSRSYAGGIAAGYLLDKNPGSRELIDRISANFGEPDEWVIIGVKRGWSLTKFSEGLMASGNLEGIALAMDDLEQKIGDNYHGPKPLAQITWRIRDLFYSDPEERVLNRILYHLSSGFHPEAAGFAVQALVAKDSERGVKFLKRQLAWSPNQYRKRAIEVALGASKS